MNTHDEHPHNRNWLERLFHNAPHNQAELLHTLREALGQQVIDDAAYSMMEGVLNVANQQVRDVMLPRTQVISIHTGQTPEEFLPVILDAAHSRFPVFDANQEEVVGVLFAKDLLKYYLRHQNRPFDISKIMRPAFFVPESKRLDTLLKDFRQSRNHLAVVVDEYGDVSGIITIEDVLEEIVGDIEDEFDIQHKHSITSLEGNRYQVDALTEISDFNEYFQTNFSDELVDTIGGLVTQQIGHLPINGDVIDIGGLHFTVTDADQRRILTLEVISPKKPAEKKS